MRIYPYQLIYEDKYFFKFLRNGIVVDSGILLEFLKGHSKIDLTMKEKEVFYKLERFLSLGCNKYITPHILAELSNLINSRIPKSKFTDFIELIRTKLKDYEEVPINKEEILEEEIVNNFGITDAGITLDSRKNKKIILTGDYPFCKECQIKQELSVIHLGDLDNFFFTLSCFK